jgi:hypothetical protein
MAITISGSGIVEANLADNAVTLAKMASGTDGEILTYDASGNPVAVSVGTDGQVLTSTGVGSPPAFEAAAAGGKVLQVVQGSVAVQVSTTSSAYQATGLKVTITPSSTSSKVLVVWHSGYNHNVGGTLILALYRAGASIGVVHQISNDASSGWQPLNGSILDSPATTSATEYELYFKSANGSDAVNVGPNDFSHKMIVTEVGA